MSTVIALLVISLLFGLLVQFARHDRFSGPAPVDRFREHDGFLLEQTLRNLTR